MDNFRLGKSAHRPNDRRCEECYSGYPRKCACGGLIHCEFLRETWANSLDMEMRCDRCGDEFQKKNRGAGLLW